MIWALALTIVIGFPLMAGGCFLLVWKLCEQHDSRLNNLLDRVQAPEAAHIAAYQELPARERSASSSYVDFPVLDEDFQLADLIEENV